MSKFIFTCICLLFIASCSISNKSEHSLPKKLSKDQFSNKNKSLSQKLIDKIYQDNNYIKFLTSNEVLNLIGSPTLINNINNIEIWQYRKNFTLNIVWNEQASIKKNTIDESSDCSTNIANISNPSIVWMECIGHNKNKIDATYCFLQLINCSETDY